MSDLDETALETPLCNTVADFSILIFEEVSLQSFLHSSKLFRSWRYMFVAKKCLNCEWRTYRTYVFQYTDIDFSVQQRAFCNNLIHARHVPNNHDLIYIFEMKQVFRLSLGRALIHKRLHYVTARYNLYGINHTILNIWGYN